MTHQVIQVPARKSKLMHCAAYRSTPSTLAYVSRTYTLRLHKLKTHFSITPMAAFQTLQGIVVCKHITEDMPHVNWAVKQTLLLLRAAALLGRVSCIGVAAPHVPSSFCDC